MTQVTDDLPGKNNIDEEAIKAQLIQQHEQKEVVKTNFPTEVIDLPSKGLLYPEGHPLANGTIEMKYMTAKEEDILTSQNLIKQGVVLDKLFQSMIVTPMNYDDLLIGDKNAIMVAARVLGYGKDYPIEVGCKSCSEKNKLNIDLTQVTDKQVTSDAKPNANGEFEFTLPSSQRVITFSLMTLGLDKAIKSELNGLKQQKSRTGVDPELSTRLKHIIKSIDGNTESAAIRHFVDNEFLAMDSRSFRAFIQDIQPDVDLSTNFTCSECDEFNDKITIPITIQFFWPGV